jgi:hypothetical protein
MAGREEEYRMFDRLSREVHGDLGVFRSVLLQCYEDILVQSIQFMQEEMLMNFAFDRKRHLQILRTMVKTQLQPIWDSQPDAPQPGDLVIVSGEGMAHMKYSYSQIIDDSTQLFGVVKGMDILPYTGKEYLYVDARIDTSDDAPENQNKRLFDVEEDSYHRPMGLQLTLTDVTIVNNSNTAGVEVVNEVVGIPFHHEDLRITTINTRT